MAPDSVVHRDDTFMGRKVRKVFKFKFHTDGSFKSVILYVYLADIRGSISTTDKYRIMKADYPIEDVPEDVREEAYDNLLRAANEVSATHES